MIEGVMMRSPSFVTIAVRKQNGEIIVKKDPFKSLITKFILLRLPFVRGIINLFEMLVIGMHAIDFSVKEAFEEPEEKIREESAKTNKILTAVTFIISIILSLVFAVFLFKFIPLLIATNLQKIFPALQKSYLLFNATDGVLRIFIFFIYILLLQISKYFRRVFEYHGAEHKAVFTYENNLPLTIENMKNQSRFHPRCGTSFVIIVFIAAVFLFTFVPQHPVFWVSFLRRLLMLPLIAAVGYEILKWTGRHRQNRFAKIIALPGLLTQRLTTKEPDEKQLEVALKALTENLNPP